MAEPDDLLDGDGDYNDIEYDLDVADEDALLAEDPDDIISHRHIISKDQRHVTYSDTSELAGDEDAIDLGIGDDELKAIPLEDKIEDDLGDTGFTISEEIEFERTVVEDSDEEEDGRKKERSRFVSERNIAVATRIPSSIPDTLDKVAVRGGGSSVGGRLKVVGGRGKARVPHQRQAHVRPLNIHINPHFRPTGGPVRWDQPYHPPPPPHFGPPPYAPFHPPDCNL